MRISSSAGSVTFALPLLVTCAISLLLSLEVFEHVAEAVEPLRPHPLEAGHPVVDGLERLPVDPVQALPSLVSHVDRSYFAEHPQMLRHLRLGQPELGHQVVDGALPAGEYVEDRAPPGFGDGVERVRGGGCSGHGYTLHTYIGICQSRWCTEYPRGVCCIEMSETRQYTVDGMTCAH